MYLIDFLKSLTLLNTMDTPPIPVLDKKNIIILGVTSVEDISQVKFPSNVKKVMCYIVLPQIEIHYIDVTDKPTLIIPSLMILSNKFFL